MYIKNQYSRTVALQSGAEINFNGIDDVLMKNCLQVRRSASKGDIKSGRQTKVEKVEQSVPLLGWRSHHTDKHCTFWGDVFRRPLSTFFLFAMD